MSLFNDKLLVSCHSLSNLFIYSREGLNLSTITINEDENLLDATWTPRGKIVYSTYNTSKVVVVAESGQVIIIHTQMAGPRCFSVSNNDIIYLADLMTGVYQSTDDGLSWSQVFNSSDGWHCEQVIQVITNHSYDFWTVEEKGYMYHLRVYSVDRKRYFGNVTWRDINIPTINNTSIDLFPNLLAYDGNMNIFLIYSEYRAVHVLSVNSHFYSQLLSSHHFNNEDINEPRTLAVDKKRQLLYVGYLWGVVGVFKLIYGDGID